jgi:hypothetical protein
MAAAKRYSVEQIIAKLRELEKRQTPEVSIPPTPEQLGISDQPSVGGGRGASG